jgi:hypothetical protein
VLLMIASSIAAQAPSPPPIRLRVHPAAAPTPALKYKLLPELEDKTPGNAALLYLRAFSPEWYSHGRPPGFANKVLDLLDTPLVDFPKKEVNWLTSYQPLKQLDKAARKETCDWEMTARVREEGVNMMFPELQSFREMAALLALRNRLYLADDNIDQAVYTLQTGFSLGRDIGQAPTLINSLVGVAISHVMVGQLEELLKHSKCPNLYWALAYLPNPLIDFRKAFEGERLFILASFPELRGIETEQLSPENEVKLLDHLSKGFDGRNAREIDQADHVTLTLLALKIYPVAKKALIEEGRKPEEVDAMPVVQVVAIHSMRQVREYQDDVYKWLALPFPEAKVGLDQAEKRLRLALSRKDTLPLFSLIPAVNKVYDAHARLARKIAALRCLEAIRMHAKDNNGKPPAKLDDISLVPVPLDPMTGKSFEYHVKDQIITLYAPPPAQERPTASNSFTYEMTIEK